MPYNDGERLIYDLVTSSGDFDALNTTRGKWGILNTGNSSHYAVLYCGGQTIEWVSHSVSQTQHRTIIQLWQRYKDEGETTIALNDYVARLIDHLRPHKNLGDDSIAWDANVTGTSEITTEWRNNSDGPSWLKQEINVDWKEQENVTYAE